MEPLCFRFHFPKLKLTVLRADSEIQQDQQHPQRDERAEEDGALERAAEALRR